MTINLDSTPLLSLQVGMAGRGEYLRKWAKNMADSNPKAKPKAKPKPAAAAAAAATAPTAPKPPAQEGEKPEERKVFEVEARAFTNEEPEQPDGEAEAAGGAE